MATLTLTTSQSATELVSCSISPKPLCSVDENNSASMVMTTSTSSPTPECLPLSQFDMYITTNRADTTRQATRENATNCTSEDLIRQLISIHAGLIKPYPNNQTNPNIDIQPYGRGNALFNELLQLCTAPYDEATCNTVLKDQRITQIIPGLRKYNSEREGIQEEYWARRILQSSSVGIETSPSPDDGELQNSSVCKQFSTSSRISDHSTIKTQENNYATAINLLKQYPGYQIYDDMTRLELNVIMSVAAPTNPPRKWAFLGSGPLPLTAICLAQLLDPLRVSSPSPTEQPSLLQTQSGLKDGRISKPDNENSVQIHNIDHCPEAIALSSQLCQKLGRLSRCLTFECTEASGSADLTSFDVVYVAVLVGREAAEKFDIISSVVARMRPGALLVIRSVHGMRRVLATAVEPAGMVQKGVVPLVVVHPWNHMTTSMIVAKVVR